MRALGAASRARLHGGELVRGSNGPILQGFLPFFAVEPSRSLRLLPPPSAATLLRSVRLDGCRCAAFRLLRRRRLRRHVRCTDLTELKKSSLRLPVAFGDAASRLRASRAWRLRRRCTLLASGEMPPSAATRFARLCTLLAFGEMPPSAAERFARLAPSAPLQLTALRADAAFGGCRPSACGSEFRRLRLHRSFKAFYAKSQILQLASLAKVPR